MPLRRFKADGAPGCTWLCTDSRKGIIAGPVVGKLIGVPFQHGAINLAEARPFVFRARQRNRGENERRRVSGERNERLARARREPEQSGERKYQAVAAPHNASPRHAHATTRARPRATTGFSRIIWM